MKGNARRAAFWGAILVASALAVAAFSYGRKSIRETSELSNEPPVKVAFVCGSDLACVATKASELERIAKEDGREDIATPAADIRRALESRDCRAALAADGRLDRLRVDPREDAALFHVRVGLMNELLNACLLAPR